MFTGISRRLADRAADRRSRGLLLALLERPTDWEHITDRRGFSTVVHTLRSPEFVIALQWESDIFTITSGYNLTMTMGGKDTKEVPAHSKLAVVKFIRRAIKSIEDAKQRRALDDFDGALATHVLSHADTLRKQEKRLAAASLFPPLLPSQNVAHQTAPQHAVYEQEMRRRRAPNLVGCMWEGQRIVSYDIGARLYRLEDGLVVDERVVSDAAALYPKLAFAA